MREILFRGKRIDNGEWVYGSSFRLNEKLNPFIMLINRGGESYEVDNDARGLYTGLKDKNGTWIFEGDILRYSEQSEHFRYLNNVCFAVFYDNLNACFAVERYVNGNYECKKRLTAFNPSEHLEVIGNIHDNPELLEGEHNG